MGFQPFGDLYGGVTREQKLVTYRTLRSDNIFANQIVISGGTKGFIRSEDFVDGVSGWALFGDGTAKLFSVSLVSDLQGNWDGTDPANLATPDTGATTGYYFDASTGSSQHMGDMWIGGDMQIGNLTGADGTDYISVSSGVIGWNILAGTPLETPDTQAYFALGIDGDTMGVYPADTDLEWILYAPNYTGVYSPWIRFNSHNYQQGSIEFGNGPLSNPLAWINANGIFVPAGSAVAFPFNNDKYYIDVTGVRWTFNYEYNDGAGGVVLMEWDETSTDFVLRNTGAGNILWHDYSAQKTYLYDGTNAKFWTDSSGVGVTGRMDFTGYLYGPLYRGSNAASATAPTFSWWSDSNTGMYNVTANAIGFSCAAAEQFRVNTSGAYLPSGKQLNFAAHASTYIHESYGIRLQGDATHPVQILAPTLLGITSTGGTYTNGYVYHAPPTTGSAANAVWTLASGSIYYAMRSTSARKYKSEIDYDFPLADYELKPNKHWRLDDERYRYGLIADDLEEQDPMFVTYNDDGEVENYEDRAVIAVLAAKVNRLEQIVKDLVDSGKYEHRTNHRTT